MKDFEKWFKKAESDLLNIHNNLQAENVPADTCCFHAQQAAEKYLKAYLVAKSIDFPKTHDLEWLIRACIKQNSIFDKIIPNIRNLYNYAITPRYPDMRDDLTVEDAKCAYQDTITVKNFILKYFFE